MGVPRELLPRDFPVGGGMNYGSMLGFSLFGISLLCAILKARQTMKGGW